MERSKGVFLAVISSDKRSCRIAGYWRLFIEQVVCHWLKVSDVRHTSFGDRIKDAAQAKSVYPDDLPPVRTLVFDRILFFFFFFSKCSV